MIARRVRVIPALLLRNTGLVKTVRFKYPVYLGDPRNVVKIFNDKDADELVLLDIMATREGRGPRIDLVSEICSEAFMPLAYGGGIRSLEQIRELVATGVEKIVLNTAGIEDPELVTGAAREIGKQSVVVSIDVKRALLTGKPVVFSHCGQRNTGLHPAEHARRMEEAGAGEILLNSIDRDGTLSGYDLKLISEVAAAVTIPVVACGGAGSVSDFRQAADAGASAVAAGSIFVFHGKYKAVLISFPSEHELRRAFQLQAGP